MSATAYDLWRPASGCGPACLPGPGDATAVPAVRRLGRLAGLLALLVAGVGLAVLLPLLPRRERAAALQGWARATARVLGVRLRIRGRLPRRRALLVANHVSWLDVLAVLSVAPARMLAKSEVRRWPLLGRLARAAGTVFVDRGRPRALPGTVARVADVLRSGHPVAVFPEGTTWCGGTADCRPGGGFRPALFQAAIDAGAPVVPLRIDYRCAASAAGSAAAPADRPAGAGGAAASAGRSVGAVGSAVAPADRLAGAGGSAGSVNPAAFLGDETLWRSVRRVLAARDLVLTVTVTAALHPAADADRRALARLAESAVRHTPDGSVNGPSPAVRVGPSGRLDRVRSPLIDSGSPIWGHPASRGTAAPAALRGSRGEAEERGLDLAA